VRSVTVACKRVKSCSGDAGQRLEEFVDYLRKQRRDVGLLLEELQEATYGPAVFRRDRSRRHRA
jgi:hypothetical protein